MIHGNADIPVPLEHAASLAIGIPCTRLVVLPGVGHRPWVEHPEAATSAILALLAGAGKPFPRARAGRQAKRLGNVADEPYGVLTGRALEIQAERNGASPHVQVLVDGGGMRYRAALNVRSSHARPGSSDLPYTIDRDLRHPPAAAVRDLPDGFIELANERGGIAIDYQRGGLFDRRGMRRIPPHLPGPDNDLADELEALATATMADHRARLRVFGHRWGPERNEPHAIFGFLPGNGIHNVHMNQGSRGHHVRDTCASGNGALLVDLPGHGRVAAVYLAFQSQSRRTDERRRPAPRRHKRGRPAGRTRS